MSVRTGTLPRTAGTNVSLDLRFGRDHPRLDVLQRCKLQKPLGVEYQWCRFEYQIDPFAPTDVEVCGPLKGSPRNHV